MWLGLLFQRQSEKGFINYDQKMQKSLAAHKAIFKMNKPATIKKLYGAYLKAYLAHAKAKRESTVAWGGNGILPRSIEKPLLEAVALTGTAWLKAELAWLKVERKSQ